MNTDIYVVSEFGCNSAHNDMYTPDISLFENREEAYKYYTNVKEKIIKEKVDYDIDFWIDYSLEDNGECIIQKGFDDNGAKRPIGAMIKKFLLKN